MDDVPWLTRAVIVLLVAALCANIYRIGYRHGAEEIMANPPRVLDYDLRPGDTIWTSGRWQYRVACVN